MLRIAISELGMVSLRQVSFGKEEETRTLKRMALGLGLTSYGLMTYVPL